MKFIPITICLLFLTLFVANSSAADKNHPGIKKGEQYKLTILGVLPDKKKLFDGLYTIDQNGNINVPLAGPVKVEGMRIAEASRAFEKTLNQKKIVRNPAIKLEKQDPIERPK